MNFRVTTAVCFSIASASIMADALPVIQNKQELDRLERQNNQYLIEEAKRTEQLLQRQRAINPTNDELLRSSPAGYKFLIKTINVVNDDLFSASPERTAIIERYQGKTLGKEEIFNLTKELTDFYIARGYATTLLTIETSNLKEGVLNLKVLWGKINNFKVNGAPPTFRESTRLFSAYPFAQGKILNMQDIDQSVENLLRVSDSDNIQVEPSVIESTSDLNLISTPEFPLSASIGINNSGNKSEGWQQYYSSLTVKNLAGFNDIFNAYYSWNNLKQHSDDMDSLSLSYGIPFGYWLFDASYYKSSYEKTIGGYYGGYLSEGDSKRTSLRMSRMLSRNSTGKTSAYMKLEYRDNQNSIEHTPIGVSSKDYTSLSSGINYVGSLMGGWFYGDLGFTAGVPWFGATWTHDKDLVGYDIDYIKYTGLASWTRPVAQFSRLGLTYELNSSFQYTPDTLISDAKISLGDEYTVRGYKDDTVMSDSGIYINNTLQLPFTVNVAGVNQLTPFLGYDLGLAKDNCPAGVSCQSQFMMGATVGAKLSTRYFSSSISAGWPVRKPQSFDNRKIDNTVAYYKMEAFF